MEKLVFGIICLLRRLRLKDGLVELIRGPAFLARGLSDLCTI
jgi:hypothetical protein